MNIKSYLKHNYSKVYWFNIWQKILDENIY